MRAEEPKVTVLPRRQTFAVGATVHVACTAVAYPKPTFEWRRVDADDQFDEQSGDIDSNNYGATDSERVSVDNDGLLTITDATKEDAGQWECIATNALGTGTDVALLDYIGLCPLHQFMFALVFIYLYMHHMCALEQWPMPGNVHVKIAHN